MPTPSTKHPETKSSVRRNMAVFDYFTDIFRALEQKRLAKEREKHFNLRCHFCHEYYISLISCDGGIGIGETKHSKNIGKSPDPVPKRCLSREILQTRDSTRTWLGNNLRLWVMQMMAAQIAGYSKIAGGKFKTTKFLLVGDGEISGPFPFPLKLLDLPMLRFVRPGLLLTASIFLILSPVRWVRALTLRTHTWHCSGDKNFVDPRSSTTNLIPLSFLSATRAYVQRPFDLRTDAHKGN